MSSSDTPPGGYGSTPPPGGPHPYSAPPTDPPPGGGGFFSALFDFGFERFVTPMIVKVAYIVATVLLVLVWLAFLLISLSSGEAAAFLLTLVLGSVGVLFYLILIRMTLEFFLAVVRMSEDVHRRGGGI